MRNSDDSSAWSVGWVRSRHRFPTLAVVLDGLGDGPLTQPEPDGVIGLPAFMASTSCWRVERPFRTKSSLSLVSVVVSETLDDSDCELDFGFHCGWEIVNSIRNFN